MKFKEIGFFRELKHGKVNGPSLKACISDKPYENELEIVKYLQSGICIAACPGLVYDVHDKSKLIDGGPHILTDGVWVWPRDLVYYVEQYHVILPYNFINHLKLNNWTVPDKSKINLDNLEYGK